jgi:hypothetical protein
MEDDRGVHARIALALVLAAVAGLSACGGGDDGNAGRDRSPDAVIRDWADTLRAGDVRGAAEFFALPSVVSNGTPPVTLRTRSEARDFNEALPCGARVLRTSSSAGFTTATFRLTERPGPGTCGTGTGLTARTTFVVRDGKIQEWRRVGDSPSPAGPLV